MSSLRVANRYALAIIGVAEELKCLDKISKDFELIEKLIKEVRDFSLFLRNPTINTKKKQSVLTNLLTSRVNDLTLKFIEMLTSKKREGLLSEIIQQFYRLRDGRLGILNVSARVAVEFTDQQKQQLVRQLENLTRKEIRVKYILEPLLKGGFVVQYDDTVWDASVRRQLELLQQKFIEGD